MIKKTCKDSQFSSKSDHIVHTHLKRHRHLANFIHLKHHVHIEKPRMMLDDEHPTEFALVKELIGLQRSRSLRNPSTSPSWKSPSTGRFLKKKDPKEQESREQTTREQTTSDYDLTPQKLLPVLEQSSGERARNCSFSIHRVHEYGCTGGDDLGEGECRIVVSKGKIASSTRTSLKHRAKNSSIHHRSNIAMDAFTRRTLARKAPEIKEGLSPDRDIRNKKRQQEMNFNGRNTEMALIVCHDNGWKEASSSVDDTNSPESDRAAYCLDNHAESRLPDSDAIRSRRWKKSSSSRLYPLFGENANKEKLDLGKQSGKESPLMSYEGTATSDRNGDLKLTELTQNGCGIPWNWSRIHNTGKNFIDLAGKGLSCGTSEPGTGRVGSAFHHSHVSSHGESVAPTCSEISNSSFGSDSESLPLLLETASPLEGGSTSGRKVYSRKFKSDIPVYEATPPFSQKDWLLVEGRQLSLSQKYRPKSFNEILGQNFVTQALSNALIRGKIASVYIFHGPRGTGKTACSRVFAAALNCLSSEEQRPCGSCSECLVHSFGNDSTVKEVSAAGNNGVKVMKTLIYDVTCSPSPRSSSRYKVVIIDDCHFLSAHAWNIFFKVLEEAPKNIVFILSTTNLEELPYAVTSRCQKFLFTKLKESAIVDRLQAIAVLENMDVDLEALKLIASIADGSLRDGEMMLEQLSLLGQKISLQMVQELVGLIPEEKLVDLLDVALSADTVNIVRKLRGLMESGVEPLALMSQLATLIMSILGGGYKLPKGNKRKFLNKDDLSKSKTERLRQALKILSDAEKQLRGSSDRTTWLTAALLQFAPDKSYLLPSSSADASFIQSPVLEDESKKTDFGPPIENQFGEMNAYVEHRQKPLRVSESRDVDTCEGFTCKSSAITTVHMFEQMKQPYSDAPESKDEAKGVKEVAVLGGNKSISKSLESNQCEACVQQMSLNVALELEDIWQRVLDAVNSNSLRQFLQNYGRLLSIKTLKAFLVAHLEFNQIEHQARAERSKKSIAHAFQATLGCTVEIKVSVARQEQKILAASGDQPSGFVNGQKSTIMALEHKNHLDKNMDGQGQDRVGGMCNKMSDTLEDTIMPLEHKKDLGKNMDGQGQDRVEDMRNKISDTLELYLIEPPNPDNRSNKSLNLVASEGENNHAKQKSTPNNEEKIESVWTRSVMASPRHSTEGMCRKEKYWDPNTFRSNSTGKSKVSLGFVIQHTRENVDGCSEELQYCSEGESLYCNLNRHTGLELSSASQKECFAADPKLEKENLRMESKSGRMLCWKLVRRSQAKVRQLHRCCRRPGLFYRLVPCAKSNQR